MDGERERRDHGHAIRRILMRINSTAANPFVLKGGTALMECYELDRFSEDINLDALTCRIP